MALEGDRRVTGVRLGTGERLDADVVVEALGSRTNVDWLDGHGFDLTDGVLTDGALRPVADGHAASTASPSSGTSRDSPTPGSGRARGGSSTGACPPTPAGGRVPSSRPT